MAEKKVSVNWESSETWERVIASLIATGVKPDLKGAAKYFGTTYDTLENRFRKIKKLAITLKEAVDHGETPPVSTTSTPRKKTPKKDALGNVANGRVTKSTPTKKSKGGVKQEPQMFENHSVFDALANHETGGLYDGEITGFSYDFEGL